MDTPTQAKIKKLGLDSIAARLEAKGLVIIDKSDLEFTQKQIANIATLDRENRTLRMQLAKARKTT